MVGKQSQITRPQNVTFKKSLAISLYYIVAGAFDDDGYFCIIFSPFVFPNECFNNVRVTFEKVNAILLHHYR